MKYNPNLFNKWVFPRFTSVTVYAKPSYSSDVLYEIKGFAGMTDGNYENVDGWNWYRLGAVDGKNVWGWVREDYVELKTVDPIEYNQAQAQLDLIIDYNMKILTNLLVCSELCRNLERNGKSSSYYKSQIKTLYSRVANRNNIIRSGSFTKDIQEGESTLVSFVPSLKAVVNDTPFVGVGLVTTIVLVIGAALVASLVTYFYQNFKNTASEASYDYEASEDLLNILSMLPAAEREKALALINKDVQKAYQEGYGKGYWKSATNITWFSILKYGAIAVGAIWVVKWIKNNF